MKVKLYGISGDYLGTGEISSMRAYPLWVCLDETPRGGKRYFHQKTPISPIQDCYVEFVGKDIESVKLDPVTT